MGAQMIAVDTNILIYYMIEGEKTGLARKIRERDPEWVIPPLWKHEFINVLAVIHMQKKKQGKDFSQYQSVWDDALMLFSESETPVDMSRALDIAVKNGISGYDAQFIATADDLDVKLVTADKELLRKFPETAVSMEAFANGTDFKFVKEKRAEYASRK
jgi:predicted nucleic acid-binding protein